MSVTVRATILRKGGRLSRIHKTLSATLTTCLEEPLLIERAALSIHVAQLSLSADCIPAKHSLVLLRHNHETLNKTSTSTNLTM